MYFWERIISLFGLDVSFNYVYLWTLNLCNLIIILANTSFHIVNEKTAGCF